MTALPGHRDESIDQRVVDLYREHGRRLFAYALGMLGQPADAEDVVQDAFLRLAGHLRAGGEDTNLHGWLYRVATNLGRDVQRARRRRAAEPTTSECSPPRALTAIALERILGRLPARDRELVLMRGAGLSYAEMAAAADIRASSVGKLLSRALARFTAAYRTEIGTENRP